MAFNNDSDGDDEIITPLTRLRMYILTHAQLVLRDLRAMGLTMQEVDAVLREQDWPQREWVYEQLGDWTDLAAKYLNVLPMSEFYDSSGDEDDDDASPLSIRLLRLRIYLETHSRLILTHFRSMGVTVSEVDSALRVECWPRRSGVAPDARVHFWSDLAAIYQLDRGLNGIPPSDIRDGDIQHLGYVEQSWNGNGIDGLVPGGMMVLPNPHNYQVGDLVMARVPGNDARLHVPGAAAFMRAFPHNDGRYPAKPAAPEPSAPDGTPDASLCTLCLDRARATVVVPCGHPYMCITCAHTSRPEACAMCRGAVEKVIPLYL